ncbi:MAG: formate dehydrogenase subunit alpha [Desulfobacterales bacterium]|nr:MAG: formate dehydrogenase subunit alpha [Desulfobacterales bacterium]
MARIKMVIDGIEIEAREEATVLEAAREAGIYIPNLCADPDLEPFGACRLCLVEVDGEDGLPTACTLPVAAGMVVRTETDRINAIRRRIIQLLMSDHPSDCLLCPKNQRCELQKVAAYLGVGDQPYRRLERASVIDSSNPFFVRDSSLCILCGKCVRVCAEVQGRRALEIQHEGRFSKIIPTGGDKPIADSICESCGQCVVKCPTGAIVPKKFDFPSKAVKSICPYCGVGCGIVLEVRGDNLIGARGDADNRVNNGSLCVKGRFGLDYVNHAQRLTTPLIRRDGKLEPATWDEALDLVTGKFARYRGKEIGVLASAKCSNEENYLIQKFGRAVLGTQHIDHCARLCHASTVAGLGLSFGSGAMTNSIEEIRGADCILAIGTDTTATHPVIGLEVRRAVREGTQLIVANPREIDLCGIAQTWIRHRPGSDVALLMGMMRVIVDEGLADTAFIKRRCENFEAFKRSLKFFDLDFVERTTGVPRSMLSEAARLYATRKPGSILYAMGITQHSHGTDNVLAIANLAMLTGNVGKPSSGVNALRGQNNVQGACDMGALPNVYPGYQRVDDPKIRKKFEQAWNRSLPARPGLTLTEIFQAAAEKEIKALYLVGENPMLSDPDIHHVAEALRQLEFFVVQDIFLTETARLAHVVLPSVTFAEKEGTFTNTERRVQRIHQAIEPVGDARPDWWITCQIARRMNGRGFDFDHPRQIMAEIAKLTPSYGGITYARLEKGGLQWPCPTKNHPGTPILHTQQFARGKGKFIPLTYQAPAELPDEEYPLILTTARNLYQYHTGTMSRKVQGINVLHGEERVEVNPQDAKAHGIQDGEMIRLVSRRGDLAVKAKVTPVSPPGVVSMSFHFSETPANVLTNSALDPVAKIPELKFCAVRKEVLVAGQKKKKGVRGAARKKQTVAK